MRIFVIIASLLYATIANAASQVDIISMYSNASATSVMIQEVAIRLNKMQSDFEFRVANIPGAAGDSAALKAISVARYDQNVLLWHGISTYSFGKFVSANVNAYDRDKDLVPVQAFAGVPFHLLVNTDDDFNSTLEKFRKKDVVYFANTGSVPTALLLNGIFVKSSGIKMPKELSYSQGPEALKSVVIGESDYVIYTQSVSEVVGLKALVTSAQVRSQKFPNVPTGKEVGMPDFNYVSTTAISVPKEKREFGEKLIPLLQKICNEPSFIERVEKLGYESKCYGNDVLTKTISSDLDQIRKYESYVISNVR